MSTSRSTLACYGRVASVDWPPRARSLSSPNTLPISAVGCSLAVGCLHWLRISRWILHAGSVLVRARLLNGNILSKKKKVHSIRFVLNNKMLTKNDTVWAKRYTFDKRKGQTAPPPKQSLFLQKQGW